MAKTKLPQKKKASSGFFEKLNNWLLFLFIFLLPTQLGKHFFFPFSYLSGVRVDHLAPTVFLTDLLVVFLILLNVGAVIRLLKNKWLALFLLLLTIGGFFAQSPELFLYRFLKVLELLGIFAVFKYGKYSPKLLFNAFLSGALFQFVLVLAQFVNKHSLQGIFYWLGERYLDLTTPGVAKASLNGVEFLRPYGTFSHPNSVAGFYLLVYAFFAGRKTWLRHVFFVLTFIIVLLTLSKTALLAFFILQLYLMNDEIRKPSCIPCLISKILLFAVPALIFVAAQTDPLSLQKRILLFQNAFVLITQYPIFGTGLGNYLIAQAKLPISLVSFPYQPVHNIFLLFLAETGILTFALAAYFGAKKFFSLRRNSVFVGCCLIIVVTGLFDHYWLTLQQNWLLLGVVMGGFSAGLDKKG